MVEQAGWVMFAAAALFVLYTYVLYPLILLLLPRVVRIARVDPPDWPHVTVTVPVYNEARQVRDTVESLLALDYPADRRQILFVSDASSDGTDDIVREYANRGIELVRMESRMGKTAAENAVRDRLTGDIVVNTDASIRLHPSAVKCLVRSFADASIGVASGRDVSTSRAPTDGNLGESGYVGYEMWVRDLETRAGGIVGSSGSLYAIRKELHQHLLPSALSRDFASALIARENGFRAVSVRDAICVVPRTSSLRREYRRKVRTMIRGMETLYYKRALLNPRRHGRFAWMLVSHKVCRWLVPWALLFAMVATSMLSFSFAPARWIIAVAAVLLVLAAVGLAWPEGRSKPRVISVPAFIVVANVAAIIATIRALQGELDPIWEPTRRDSPSEPPRRADVRSDVT